MNSNADKTAYPELYSKTYWGASPYREEICTPEVIQNRNRFVSQFSIVDLHSSRIVDRARVDGPISTDFTDHWEAYRTASKGVVVIVSPYQKEGCMIPSTALRVGFMPYRKMYHPDAATFVAVFASVSHFRKTFNIATLRSPT
jgi:hypothetical protein